MFGLGAVAAGQIAHFAPWFGEQLIVLSTSFLGARFAATRAFWDGITGDQGQHLLDEFLLLPWGFLQ